MHIVETDWWSLELPEEWQAESSEDGVLIQDDDQVSQLEISAMKKDGGGAVEENDLLALAEDLLQQGQKAVSVLWGDFSGFEFAYQEDEYWVREAYVAAADVVLLISYDCDYDHRDMDTSAVNEILDTLILLEEVE